MRNFVFNKKSAPVFGLIIIQQLIVASSTYFLTRAAAMVTAGEFPLAMLVAFLISLFLPYLPGIYARVLTDRWEFEFHEGFLSRYMANFGTRIDLWRHKATKLDTLGLVSQELPQTAQSWTSYHSHLFSTSLNVALNLITIGIVVDSSFLLAFAVSVGLSAMAIKLGQKHIEQLSTEAQNTRIKLSGVISNSWNYITLGNAHSIKGFRSEADGAFAKMKASNLKVSTFTNMFFLGMVLIAFAPSLINTVLMALKWQSDSARLASLLVVLPRLFLILTYTYELLQQIFDWSNQVTRLKGLTGGLNPALNSEQGTIVLEKIRVNQQSLAGQSLSVLADRCRAPGRLTIEGDNGSGKTTLLLKLKQKLGEKAHYVPPFGEEQITNAVGRSTGQLIHDGLCTLMNDLPQGTVLLLDEWNANLDAVNKAKLTALLDQHATKNCVVEIVHRSN